MSELKNPYDKSYFEGRGKTSSSPYLWEYKRYHFEIVVNALRFFKPTRVLDVGCAKGFLVYLFKEKGICAYGIDVSRYAIESAPLGVKDCLKVVDVERQPLPFADNLFDLIVGLEIIEHLNSFDNLLKECFRLLKPGGHLFFTTPFPGSWDAQNDITHINVHPPDFWRRLFGEYGFKCLDKEEYKKFIAHFIKNYKRFIALAPSERGLIKLLNKFGWLGRFVRSQLQVYINFFSPFKSTILLVFKK